MKTLLQKAIWWIFFSAEVILTFIFLSTKSFIILQGIIVFLVIVVVLAKRKIFIGQVQHNFNIVFKRKRILFIVLFILLLVMLLWLSIQHLGGEKQVKIRMESLNQVGVNPTGNNFIDDLSSVSQQGTLSIQAVTSVGIKVIMDVKDRTFDDIVVKKAPTRIQYSGSYVEIGPERKKEIKSFENGEFLKLIIGVRCGNGSECGDASSGGNSQKKQAYYFNPNTFNYIELANGSITRERSMTSRPQDFKNVNIRVQTSAQQIEDKITSIQNSYEKRTERQLGKYNKMGYNHQLTKAQREDNSILVSKFKQILRSLNYFTDLDSQTIIKDYKCSGTYKVIYPNYKIEISAEIRIVIRVSSYNGQHYYFSNPEYLPIFFEEIPPVIEKFVTCKNSDLTTKRKQASNEYSEKFILSDKETVESTKVLVLDKIKGTSQYIKDFPRTLAESGFKFYNSLDQDYHVIWIISDKYLKLNSSELTLIKEQYHKGTGIFIWADNHPFYADANRVLKQLGFSFNLTGNYLGKQILKASDELTKQTFDLNHPVSSGLKTLYEGITICYPDKVTDGFQVFAYNSNPKALQPESIYKKATTQTGGIWIDTGFTKLQPQFHKSNRNEVIRYFTNVSLYIRKKEYLT